MSSLESELKLAEWLEKQGMSLDEIAATLSGMKICGNLGSAICYARSLSIQQKHSYIEPTYEGYFEPINQEEAHKEDTPQKNLLDEWLSVACVPMNTYVLFYCPHDKDPAISVGRYEAEEWGSEYIFTRHPKGGYWKNPTHWKHLPEGPTDDSHTI